jgi:hypothetical protein
MLLATYQIVPILSFGGEQQQESEKREGETTNPPRSGQFASTASWGRILSAR